MRKSERRPLKRQEPVEGSVPQVLRRRISTEDEVHDSSFPSGRKGRWLLSASSVVTMVYGGHLHLVHAAEAIAPLIAHSPFMSWLSVFGVGGEAKIVGTIELTTAAALIIGSVNPTASALGAAMACATFLLTTSFVFSTPGITLISPSGFPIISTLLEQFLLKDVALLAACLTLLLASLSPRPAAS